jgi:multiple sugar transport system permease protein
MPIIPRVGRKAIRIRFLLACVYAVLTLGAVTMVYPFLLMLSTSITSSTDTNEFRVVPRYLYDEAPLFAKYVDDKYAGEIELVNAIYHTDFRRLDLALPPASQGQNEALVREWREFVKTLPDEYKSTAFRGYGFHPKMLTRRYQAFTRERFGGDIRKLNKEYTEENLTFDTVSVPIERSNKRNYVPDESPKTRDFLKWKQTLPEEFKPVFSVDALFAQFLKEDVPAYGGKVEKAESVWGKRKSFDEISLARLAPADPGQRRDWEAFVRKKLPFRYLRVGPEAVTEYRAFVRRKYSQIAKLNEAYAATFASWEVVPVPKRIPYNGPINVDWSEFIASDVPLETLVVDSPENRFRQRLVETGLAATGAVSETVQPPYYAADALYVHENAAGLRRGYIGRNYSIVLDYILLHGRSLLVTALFCGLVVITTLVVNPLCAYALSRFQLTYAYRILLFVLATMAFPAEVAMIPNFLMLKELGLLNTYWALILPGMASGFSIFLLKGFFDSLPRELYEAGTIDGASETRMFFLLAIPLSKPIFAVIALNAFTAAYGAFMFALHVCQDPRMWTLMVWLYELQANNPQYIMMAGLAIAALPTLLVFVFAQNVIMRGIILPSEK